MEIGKITAEEVSILSEGVKEHRKEKITKGISA